VRTSIHVVHTPRKSHHCRREALMRLDPDDDTFLDDDNKTQPIK